MSEQADQPTQKVDTSRRTEQESKDPNSDREIQAMQHPNRRDKHGEEEQGMGAVGGLLNAESFVTSTLDKMTTKIVRSFMGLTK